MIPKNHVQTHESEEGHENELIIKEGHAKSHATISLLTPGQRTQHASNVEASMAVDHMSAGSASKISL